MQACPYFPSLHVQIQDVKRQNVKDRTYRQDKDCFVDLLPGIEVQVEVTNGLAIGGIIHSPLLHILVPHLNIAQLSFQQSNHAEIPPRLLFW